MTGFELSPPPHGFACEFVSEAAIERRAAARQFCLDTIHEVYGTEYRSDWHADLDSLTDQSGQNWFSRENRGAFWSLRALDGEIAATAGLYRLAWKPGLAATFADRYPLPDDVTQLVRVYVRKNLRGRGIGHWLARLAQAEARRQNFETLYLHANTDTAATIAFWRAQGFGAFASAEGTTHFDKSLTTEPIPSTRCSRPDL